MDGGADSEPWQAEREPWQGQSNPLVLAGEPRLVYQPVVDLGSGQLLGLEALHPVAPPDRGRHPPGACSSRGPKPTATSWRWANGSCAKAAARPSVGPRTSQLAVNCSIVQLRRGACSAAVVAALEESGLTPDRLTVECTERALSDDGAVTDLRMISGLGVQLAVDDVGTSWNSFEILRRLAVNTVKIDDSFVMGLEAREGINRMIVETVVHLAHNCGMSTVAEGVETALHAAIVREFDSDAGQGYYFAPPLSQDNATKLANLVDLRFPLSGPGWDDDDDWPFPGASEDNGRLPLGPARSASSALAAATSTDTRVEIDGIDFVDLALDAAGAARRGTRATPTSRATRTGRPVTPGAARTRRPTPSCRPPATRAPIRWPRPRPPPAPRPAGPRAPRTADLGSGCRRRPARNAPVKLAVPAETRPGERRVALVPDVVKRLVDQGWSVSVQAGAGAAAAFPDSAFAEAGALIAPDAAAALADAAVVVRVQPLSAEEAEQVAEGAIVVSFLQPASAEEALAVLAKKRASVFSFDLVPRISRAQGMDALSSQATVSGYRAGLAAAEHLAKFFPMFMTAAGTVPPAKVLVMGVGVAGLQAIATARRLGAVVARLRRAGRGQRGGREPRGDLRRPGPCGPRAPAGTPASSPTRSWRPSGRPWPPRWRRPTWSSPPPRCPAARPRSCSPRPWSTAWARGRW